MVVNFGFFHAGMHWTREKENRIRLNVLDATTNDPQLHIKTQIGDDTLILVNSDEPNYATTYALTVSLNDLCAVVKVEDLPELGEILVNDSERNGIKACIDISLNVP